MKAYYLIYLFSLYPSIASSTFLSLLPRVFYFFPPFPARTGLSLHFRPLRAYKFNPSVMLQPEHRARMAPNHIRFCGQASCERHGVGVLICQYYQT